MRKSTASMRGMQMGAGDRGVWNEECRKKRGKKEEKRKHSTDLEGRMKIHRRRKKTTKKDKRIPPYLKCVSSTCFKNERVNEFLSSTFEKFVPYIFKRSSSSKNRVVAPHPPLDQWQPFFTSLRPRAPQPLS